MRDLMRHICATHARPCATRRKLGFLYCTMTNARPDARPVRDTKARPCATFVSHCFSCARLCAKKWLHTPHTPRGFRFAQAPQASEQNPLFRRSIKRSVGRLSLAFHALVNGRSRNAISGAARVQWPRIGCIAPIAHLPLKFSVIGLLARCPSTVARAAEAPSACGTAEGGTRPVSFYSLWRGWAPFHRTTASRVHARTARPCPDQEPRTGHTGSGTPSRHPTTNPD